MRITVFSDYICPFCYVGIETLQKVQSEVPPFTLEWKGFQIHPEYPSTGVPMEQRIAQYGQGRYAVIWRNILSLAEGIGLEMKPPSVLTNSLMALEATEYARDQGKEKTFSNAVYQAYFQRGQNIGDIDVILALAEQAGLNPSEVQDHLKAGTYSARIQASHEEARAFGVSGVPTFIVGPAQIVGAQSPEVFVSMLKRVAERGLAQ
ncbi:MAG: DsbA family oxidoreductase [Deltaproteobacteria bacterium]|nr:DsbA family oxidoreductase [Deltaproteobacteria bacterium]